jgi:acyl-coenzyme A thioesterase PaaI-like protein
VTLRQLQPTPESLAAGETKDKPFLELVALLDLEKGVNGYAGTAHGGFFTVVLDEVMGSAVNVLSGELLRLF